MIAGARRGGEVPEAATELERLRRDAALLQGQADVLERIAAGAPLSESLGALIRLIEAQAAGMLGSILLLDPDGVHVRHGAAPSLPAEFTQAIDGQPIGERAGSCGTAAYRREPVVVEDIAADPLWADYRDLALAHGLRACWSTPIFDSRGSVLGTFALYFRAPGKPTEHHWRLIGLATHVAAIAIGKEREAEALRQSEARYRQIVETAQEGVWTLDRDGRTSFVNPRMAEMLGYTVAEMRGRLLFDFMDDEARAAAEENLRRRQAGIAEHHEFRFRRKDRSDLWALLATNPLTDDTGAYAGALAMVADVGERRRAEAELRRARDYAEALIQTANALVVGLDAAGKVTVFNEAAERITGYTRADLSGRNWFEVLVPRALYPEVWEEFRRLTAAGGVPRTFENPIRTRDGEERHVLWQNTVLRDGDRVAGTLSFGVDVTERKRAEEALRVSEERFSSAFRAGPAGMTITRIADGAFLEVNDAFLAMFEHTREETIGHTSTELGMWAPVERERLIRAQLQAGGLRNCELRARARSGREVDILFSSTPLELGGERCLVTTMIDITERKRAEAALRESEARLRLTLEATGIGLWDWNMGTDLWYATPIYFQMLGYDPDAEGQNREVWGERTHPDDRAFVVREMETVRDQGKHGFDIEFRFRHADGSYRWINSIGRAVEFDSQGRAVRMLGLQIDVTERRQARDEIQRLNETLEQRVVERTRELEAANRELEAFTYSVSHDLRAPLRAIDGFTGILVEEHEGALGAEGQRVCGVIRDNARRMARLIDDLLSLSRVGRRGLADEAVDMEGLARAAALEAASPEERARGDLRIGRLPAARGDPNLLRQVWANLLGNAWKFSARRERPAIEVGAEERPGEVRYWVRDNGAGFDMAYAGKLFGVFQRLHGQDEFEGTGVGLAIVKRIVDRHGGGVWAEGRVGQGATFGFSLPARGASGLAPPRQAGRPAKHPTS